MTPGTLIVNLLKYYLGAVFSLVALAGFFAPWLAATHLCLGFHILSCLWFLQSWIWLLVHLVLAIVWLKKHRVQWKHHLIAAAVILGCGVVFLLSIGAGLCVTV